MTSGGLAWLSPLFAIFAMLVFVWGNNLFAGYMLLAIQIALLCTASIVKAIDRNGKR